VQALDLADRDHLTPDNLRHHACDAADLSRPKAAAVADFLRQHVPAIAARPHDVDVLKQPDTLRRLVAGADFVLVAVDDEAPKRLVNAMARELGRPAVDAGVYGGGWGAEMIVADLVVATTCYACAARALGRWGVAAVPTEAGPDYAHRRLVCLPPRGPRRT
jgi:molybdopterin/thiamine biosynthesis adenylyltransferase